MGLGVPDPGRRRQRRLARRPRALRGARRPGSAHTLSRGDHRRHRPSGAARRARGGAGDAAERSPTRRPSCPGPRPSIDGPARADTPICRPRRRRSSASRRRSCSPSPHSSRGSCTRTTALGSSTASRRAEATGEWEDTYRVLRPDGGVRWVHGKGRRVESDEPDISVWHGVTIDVTAQVEAAQAAGLAPSVWATPPG